MDETQFAADVVSVLQQWKQQSEKENKVRRELLKNFVDNVGKFFRCEIGILTVISNDRFYSNLRSILIPMLASNAILWY